jgi:hypothetical protein
LRQQRVDSASRKHPVFFLKTFTAALIALFILVSSSLTVFAAQSSLPGEILYPVKSWSENIRLSLTYSPQARTNLTLDFTERRIDEITSLVSEGRSLPDSTSERFNAELERALELAAQMDDDQMHFALGQIKKQAESQGMTLEELLNTLPAQAKPALLRLKLRLQEQVTLSSIGESDPQAFRSEIHKRQQNKPGSPKSEPEDDGSQLAPGISPTERQPSQEEPENETGDQPGTPGNNGNGDSNGPAKPNPGNGNNGRGP